MNRPDLSALLSEWKPLLGCSDWRIACRYVADLPDRAVAQVSALWQYLEANIEILDPATRQHDVEETLVHELAHLPLAPFENEPGSMAEALEERAVETYARALIAIKRNKAPTAIQSLARKQLGSAVAGAVTRFRKKTTRYRMWFDPVRFGEIMMELGGMPDLPEPAKALIAELAGMATGAETSVSDPVDPMLNKDAPKPGDVAPANVFRLQADKYAQRRMLDEKSMAADTARTKARKVLGDRCTPAFEQRLLKMDDPDRIDAAVQDVLSAVGAPVKSRETVQEPTDPKTGAKPLGAFTARLAARGVLNGGAQ